jgi:prolyl-tRNA synthetase
MLKSYVSSYKHLPIMVYQFQNKLRNELRAKSGILRGREFQMKDAYTFCATEEQHNKIYNEIKDAYIRIFARIGLGEDTYVTYASGGAFTEFSHEFQTICEAGEDVCYVSKEKGVAVNEEVLSQDTLAELGVTEAELAKTKMAEVGNIFNFGRQKAADLDLTFTDETEQELAVWMGSYGIGVSRLMGVLVEKFSDEKGIVWPASVAPASLHLVGLNLDDNEICDWVDGVYATCSEAGISVLYDDRVTARPGEKFADSDLMGMPYRVVASRKTKESGQLEVVTRATGEVRLLTLEELLADFTE